MKIRMLLIIAFCFFTICGYSNNRTTKEEKIVSLQKQIEYLQEKKRGFKAKEAYHISQGNRLQFKDGELYEAKRHWKVAEFNRKMAEEMQTKINELEKQKQKLLK